MKAKQSAKAAKKKFLNAEVEHIDVTRLQGIVPLLQGRLELGLEAVGGGPQVVATLARRLGEGRIGEMRWITDAGALFLGLDLPIEVAGHSVEFADHVLQIGRFACFFVGGEALQSQRRFTCFHRSIPRTNSNYTAQG